MITVGDQIFALNKEVKELKKQCEQYQKVLQDIVVESTGHPEDAHKCGSLAQSALTQFYPIKGTA